MNAHATMSADEEALALLVEDYLDHALTPREVRAFETRLLEPAVARMLAECLAVRTMLTELPPDEVPDGLVARIEDALGVDATDAAPTRLGRLRASMSGAAWAIRGIAQIGSGTEDSFHAAGLVTAPVTGLFEREPPRRALWRRILFRKKG